MIIEKLGISAEEFERGTGWAMKPEGACKDDRCVPVPDADGRFDARAVAERLRMPIVDDAERGLWCIGPEAGAPPLASARAPDLVLEDWRGDRFALSSLRGLKVLMVAWASW